MMPIQNTAQQLQQPQQQLVSQQQLLSQQQQLISQHQQQQPHPVTLAQAPTSTGVTQHVFFQIKKISQCFF